MAAKKTLTLLTVTTLIICIAATINTATAKPTAEITIDPKTGTIDQTIAITGSNFAKNSKVTIEFFKFQITTDKQGSFSGKATVLKGLTAGTYDVEAVDESGNTAKTTFTVEPSITLKPSLSSPGSEIPVYGCGFLADSVGNGLTMLFDGKEVKLEHLCNAEEKGTFTATFIVPDILPGLYTVVINDAKNPEVCASTTFYVTAFVVTPENPFGAFIAILSCAGAAIVFLRKHRKQSSEHPEN